MLVSPHFFTIFCQYDHQTCQQFNAHTHTPLLHFNISKNGTPSTLLLAWGSAMGCPVSLGICRSFNSPMSLPSARFPVQPGRRNWSSGLTTCRQARLRKQKKQDIFPSRHRVSSRNNWAQGTMVRIQSHKPLHNAAQLVDLMVQRPRGQTDMIFEVLQ